MAPNQQVAYHKFVKHYLKLMGAHMLVQNPLEQKLLAFLWTVCSSSNNAPHPVTLPQSQYSNHPFTSLWFSFMYRRTRGILVACLYWFAMTLNFKGTRPKVLLTDHFYPLNISILMGWASSRMTLALSTVHEGSLKWFKCSLTRSQP